MALENPRFEASYSRLFGSDISAAERSDAFFRAFYRRFLDDDEVAGLFAETDMERQVQMLKRSLFQLVSFYVVGSPTPELERIARYHDTLALPAGLYDVWMQALLGTVKEFDPLIDEATELAWCWALAPGITYMQLAQTASG